MSPFYVRYLLNCFNLFFCVGLTHFWGSDARNVEQTVVKLKINVKFIIIAQLVG